MFDHKDLTTSVLIKNGEKRFSLRHSSLRLLRPRTRAPTAYNRYIAAESVRVREADVAAKPRGDDETEHAWRQRLLSSQAVWRVAAQNWWGSEARRVHEAARSSVAGKRAHDGDGSEGREADVEGDE